MITIIKEKYKVPQKTNIKTQSSSQVFWETFLRQFLSWRINRNSAKWAGVFRPKTNSPKGLDTEKNKTWSFEGQRESWCFRSRKWGTEGHEIKLERETMENMQRFGGHVRDQFYYLILFQAYSEVIKWVQVKGWSLQCTYPKSGHAKSIQRTDEQSRWKKSML